MSFPAVLLVDGDEVTTDAAALAGASVTATVVEGARNAGITFAVCGSQPVSED